MEITSREAGSVGGNMVKKMVEAYEQGLKYNMIVKPVFFIQDAGFSCF